jgi:hypothetical protein
VTDKKRVPEDDSRKKDILLLAFDDGSKSMDAEWRMKIESKVQELEAELKKSLDEEFTNSLKHYRLQAKIDVLSEVKGKAVEK